MEFLRQIPDILAPTSGPGVSDCGMTGESFGSAVGEIHSALRRCPSTHTFLCPWCTRRNREPWVARTQSDRFQLEVDLDHAMREGERVRDMLAALRRRHDLARYEYTRVVRIVPGGETFAHPVLTLGNRFATSEDLLLSTYLHEQMHWYLWHLGTPERDMVAPFMDELVRRYPDAPIDVANGGARGYESTYEHLVVNWLELAAASEFIGRERTFALARAQRLRSYGWLYDVVVRDWDQLEKLYKRHGIVPIRSAAELRQLNTKARVNSRRQAQPRSNANGHAASAKRAINGARRKTPAAAPPSAPPRSRRRPPARGGRSVE
jgi:hypothetical protein